GRVLQLRRLEELPLRRPAHLRARGNPVLHARQGCDLSLAGPGDFEGRPRLPADPLISRRAARPSGRRTGAGWSSPRLAGIASATCSSSIPTEAAASPPCLAAARLSSADWR